jgi:hypothetical protein
MCLWWRRGSSRNEGEGEKRTTKDFKPALEEMTPLHAGMEKGLSAE